MERPVLIDRTPRGWRRASLPDRVATVVFMALVLTGAGFCLKIVYGALGLLGAVAGAILFPVLVTVTPWYALAALGDPVPAVLCYGAVVAWALIAIPARAWRFYRDD